MTNFWPFVDHIQRAKWKRVRYAITCNSRNDNLSVSQTANNLNCQESHNCNYKLYENKYSLFAYCRAFTVF